MAYIYEIKIEKNHEKNKNLLYIMMTAMELFIYIYNFLVYIV